MIYDAIVIGAGFAGATAARRLAEDAGLRVLVVERRSHIGGNAYDCMDASGVRIHRYGPHIFHTNSQRVYEYLSRFTQWLPYHHRVMARVDGQYLPVPFNLTALRIAFGEKKGEMLQQRLLAQYGEGSRVTILELRQSTDTALQEVADYVYEHIFLHYTMKQWGKTPEEIDPATTARVPILLSRDDGYFQDAYQGMPKHGYTALFEKLLEHPNITVQLNTDARKHLSLKGGVYWDDQLFQGAVIYTGSVDELFACDSGSLPYRTLDFVFETLPVEQYQPCGTVNYTISEDYTRITEFKHLTGQKLPECTTIMKEYSRVFTGNLNETPYYAIINEKNNTLHQSYAQRLETFPNVYLLGRLAEYKYYNMDAIVERALTLCDAIADREEQV